MKLHSSLTFVACAFALGVTFAQPSAPLAAAQNQTNPLERLATLEKVVVELSAKVSALSAIKPDAAKPGGDEAQVKDLAKQMDQVLVYLAAQAESAKRLDAKLKESEALGFTWGINPESRTTMLAGFADFTTTLVTDVPSPKKAGAPATARR